jgi:hypothetical protein
LDGEDAKNANSKNGVWDEKQDGANDGDGNDVNNIAGGREAEDEND